MKILVPVAVALLAGALPASALVTVHVPDGITAAIAIPTSAGDVVLMPDEAGNVVFQVSIYRSVGGAWSQAGMWATLRAFHLDPVAGEEDVLLKPFLASASGPATITVPASKFAAQGFYDVFVTFSNVQGNPLPTSHHSLAKNAAIGLGAFDAADALDYNGNTRVVSV